MMDLSSYNNKHYNPGNIFKRSIWYFANLIFIKNPWIPSSAIKKSVLVLFGAKIGKGVVIKPSVNVKYPWNLKIGHHVWIGEGVWIDNLGKVEIKNNVCISQGAMLLTGNHNYKKETFDLIVKDILLEDGVWIGAKSVVCPGVHCGVNSILTAGSIATNHLNSDMIYQGNPATEIRKRSIDEG